MTMAPCADGLLFTALLTNHNHCINSVLDLSTNSLMNDRDWVIGRTQRSGGNWRELEGIGGQRRPEVAHAMPGELQDTSVQGPGVPSTPNGHTGPDAASPM